MESQLHKQIFKIGLNLLNQTNQNLNDNQISNQTIDELINDAIKISAAEEIGITSSEKVVKANLDAQLRSQGSSLEEYSKFLESNNINPQTNN